MSKYRILEKKGEYKCVEGEVYKTVYRCTPLFCNVSDCKKHPYCAEIPAFGHQLYIPRFIVQEHVIGLTKAHDKENGTINFDYKDLKEFTNLEEARAYKRDLELEEGIVRE